MTDEMVAAYDVWQTAVEELMEAKEAERSKEDAYSLARRAFNNAISIRKTATEAEFEAFRALEAARKQFTGEDDDEDSE